jgi:hypothetical protein
MQGAALISTVQDDFLKRVTSVRNINNVMYLRARAVLANPVCAVRSASNNNMAFSAEKRAFLVERYLHSFKKNTLYIIPRTTPHPACHYKHYGAINSSEGGPVRTLSVGCRT